jgi:hypothetical protein
VSYSPDEGVASIRRLADFADRLAGKGFAILEMEIHPYYFGFWRLQVTNGNDRIRIVWDARDSELTCQLLPTHVDISSKRPREEVTFSPKNRDEAYQCIENYLAEHFPS